MRIFVKGADAGWVLDNIMNDYKKHTRHKIVDIKDSPDIFWSLNLFDFPHLYTSVPKSCLSFAHIHHINETQLNEYNFDAFNKAHGCIVYNKKVEITAAKYMKIPIYRLPYWIISGTTEQINDKNVKDLKKRIGYGGELLIGSFQKDGNGNVGDTPKISKGPDTLVEILTRLSSMTKIKVVLGGYARQYVIKKLEEKRVPYVYLPKYEDINSLYDCLDWYFVTSRCEGGPQAVLEASYRKIKILSTDVGVASEILHPDCICNGVNDFIEKVQRGIDKIDYNYNQIINNYLPSNVISKWDDFFESQYMAKNR